MDARFYSGVVVSTVAQAAATVPMPTGLHITPGVYVLGGVGYDCTATGLYRFFDKSTGICLQKICWTTDVDSYVSAWSWIHIDGRREDWLDATTLQALAKQQKLAMSCGFISDFMCQLISQYPYPARRVQVLTAGTPNGYDDGHIIFEEKSTGVWRLWDMTNGCYFADSNGTHLDLKGIAALGAANCQMVKVAQKWSSSAVSVMATGTFDYQLYEEFYFSTDEDVRSWVKRIYQIPVVGTSCYLPIGMEGRASWMQSLGFSVLSKAAWEAQFYS